MASRVGHSYLLNINLPALSPVSGAISGTTPKTSAWIKLRDVYSVALVLTTTSTAAGSWSFQVATTMNGQDSKALPNAPTTPTGTSQNSTVIVAMPGDEYRYLQITFTPSAGSGNANAQVGEIVGMPVPMGHYRYAGIHSYTAATDTLAGQLSIDESGNFDGGCIVGQQGVVSAKQVSSLQNDPSNPALWTPMTDCTDTQYTIPALLASTGQNLPLRLAIFEFLGLRARFTPSAGAGSVRVHLTKKA